MYTSTRMKDGRVLMVEIHVCLKCFRPIILNDEPHYKMYVPKWMNYSYAHKTCPPQKEQKQLGHS